MYRRGIKRPSQNCMENVIRRRVGNIVIPPRNDFEDRDFAVRVVLVTIAGYMSVVGDSLERIFMWMSWPASININILHTHNFLMV